MWYFDLMNEKMPDRIEAPAVDDMDEVYYPEPFDPNALRHDPDASALQMQGRKPRQPVVNEEGEIVGWGMHVLRQDSSDTQD